MHHTWASALKSPSASKHSATASAPREVLTRVTHVRVPRESVALRRVRGAHVVLSPRRHAGTCTNMQNLAVIAGTRHKAAAAHRHRGAIEEAAAWSFARLRKNRQDNVRLNMMVVSREHHAMA